MSTGSTNGLDSLMGTDTFLQLFCSQLKNQDPLNPMDSNSFTQQLAQLSSVEQLVTISDGMKTLNSNMKSMLNYQASLNNEYATTLLGRTVTYGDTGQTGIVTGLDFSNGTMDLTLKDGTKIGLGDIKSITA